MFGSSLAVFCMIKLNVDVALFSRGGLVGCGCVLRNSTGMFISARASNARVKLQPHEIEAFLFFGERRLRVRKLI